MVGSSVNLLHEKKLHTQMKDKNFVIFDVSQSVGS